MPTTDVLMPQMGESITEGTVTKWLKKVGDPIGKDEPLFEISTDKVDAEIPSPVSGSVAAILVKEGQQVTKGQKVAEMGNSDTDQVKLHFEVRRFGKPLDPGKFLPAR